MPATSMLTDRYELSMLQSFIAEGMQDKHAVFEVFARKLQPGFRYGVFAGLGRLLPMIEDFRFPSEEVNWLFDNGVLTPSTGPEADRMAEYLSDFRFTGKIIAYSEGDLYFPNSPVLTVEGTLGECILLETLILSVINHDSAIATKAARIKSVAEGRNLIEMGSRRTHEESAVAAARAAYIAGFNATSNLAAGMQYGVPTAGTAAHAFTLAHESEEQAFAAQIAAHGTETSLLIDTYDIRQGTLNAVAAVQSTCDSPILDTTAATGPGAVRIDSGDLAKNAFKVREILDSLGATETKIVVTSDLDEHVVKDLAHAPIDGYGVGTRLVSTPPSGFVYKLVAIESERSKSYQWDPHRSEKVNETRETYMRPVAKKSKDKSSVGGKKKAWREYDRNGKIAAEYFTPWESLSSIPEDHVLQTTVMDEGKITMNMVNPLEVARDMFTAAFSELPESEQHVWGGHEFGPYITAEPKEESDE